MAAELAPITVEGSPTPPPQQEVRAHVTEPGRVAVTTTGESVDSIPIAEFQEAAAQGYRPATDVELYRAQTGTAGTAMAALMGVGRGLSFGTFDTLATGATRALEGDKGADEMRQTLRLLKEGHENASLIGEIGGSLAPLAFGAAPAGAAAAGESLLARAGARAVSAMPRAALEGAAIGLGSQLSEDTLGNHDLVAQKYLSSALKGGIFGVILGAGLHAGTGAIGDILAQRGAGAAEKAAARAEGAAVRAESAAAESAPKYRSLGDRAADFAEEQAAKGAMPSASLNASELQKLGRTAEEQQARVRQIGRTLLDEGITTAGATKATQAVRLTKRVAEVGNELGTIRSSLEKAAARPSAETVMDRIRAEVLQPLETKPFSWAEQSSVRPFVEEIEKVAGDRATFKSFDELHKLRVALDKKLDPKLWQKLPGTAPAGFEELGQIRGILESEFESAAERASSELGEGVAQKYRVTKALYSDLKTAEKWATKAAARETQNRAVSLTDTLMAGAAVASGHPVAVLAPVANKLARTFGNQAAAVVSDKAAKLLGVQRASEAFDKRLASAVKGFYAGGKKGPKVPSGESPKISPDTARALRAAVKDPAAMTERVASVVGATGLHDVAPGVAQSMTNAIMRAATYLGHQLPPEPPPAGFRFGPSKPRALGPHGQAKMEAAIGALDLDGLLADIERGRVDRQKVEALRIIHPEAHAEIVGALARAGQDRAATLTHQQEVALSILTGKPIGVMMQPRTIRGFQQAHAKGTPPDPAAQAGGQLQPIGNASRAGESRTASTFRSGTDRMEATNG